MAANGDSRRAIFYALGANFAIFLAKGAAAFVTGSSAMLAEAVHSLADCGNQGLLLLGVRQARRPPTPDYPVGYGKAIYFWSFLVALILFSVGGMFSLYEGWHKLQSPRLLQHWGWAVGVLGFAIVAESVSMRACLREVAKSRDGRTLWQWLRESRQAELMVIFGEDLAALLGLVLAMAAVVASALTGSPLWDALGTLAIGALLIAVAGFIAVHVKALLIGRSVEPARQRQMQAFLEARPEFVRLFNLITLQLGNDVMVSMKVEMAPDLDTRGVAERINAAEAAFRAEFPEVMWCFVEPDVAD